jgi:hypothetical protein
MVVTLAKPLTWLVAVIASLTVVRDPLVPIGIPLGESAATPATLKASNCWSASTASLRRAANDRVVRIESEKRTRTIPEAGPIRDRACEPVRRGRAKEGRPEGIDPVLHLVAMRSPFYLSRAAVRHARRLARGPLWPRPGRPIKTELSLIRCREP